MKSERKAALLAITENIEMKLFSSEESCVVIPAQEKDEKYSFDQRRLEHPLVPDCDEEPELQVQTKLRHLAKPKTESPTKDEAKHCSHVPEYMEEIQIEMEVFPPLRVPESELIEMNSNNSSIMTLPSPNKASRLKWKRQTLQQTGLVVKDVVCLPRGQYLAQLERHIVPQGKERAALVATGMTARITIDCGWSANQMQSRLALLFRRLFIRRLGQRFSFTYLQCVQGSRALFVPETPAEGWTGEQVLRISGHGALYIISHQNYPECTLDLDIILRLFRQQNVDRDIETHICVRRGELLRSALKVLMCGQNPSLEDFDWNDIVDTEAQMYLQQSRRGSTVEASKLPHILFIYSDNNTHSNNNPTLDISHVCTNIGRTGFRVTSMISQFINGLNSCGELWDMVQSHWEVFVPVMTNTQQQPLTLEEFKQLFTACYSRPDSQLRAAEEATVRHWETVLTLVSGGKADFSFEDLLIFITGTDHLPPLGFPKMISLHFYSQDASTSGVRLPYASTCALELFLQRGVARAADLLALLSRAVRESLCFTQFHGEDGCKK
ncbi:G2/M phase-specific E3 ubiquitin-protein ligase [Collichthys lucidus]|uniref:G2/M phase-specific E3 ubiquitin-protein ligase n=1 Tax=Collichthys lucidus TaxID=240159 RepID=A0A4U5UHM2_COLLU|nr:G2/M phase-specific E3 ubiquitin-protein ligase [Collichthys lucidus]